MEGNISKVFDINKVFDVAAQRQKLFNLHVLFVDAFQKMQKVCSYNFYVETVNENHIFKYSNM